MVFLAELNFDLPLSNPVIIFSLVLFIILFAPILFNRIRVPHIIGLILAGMIVGPYGFNLLRRDSSILLFGTVGLLYIMFLAGLEIDLSEFKKNKLKIIVFGLFTFIIPLGVGILASYYLLGFNMMSSVLLASMFSTHTLISYPIASKFGVARSKAVTLTIGGTMITDIFALLILAAVAGLTRENLSPDFWINLGVSFFVFIGIVLFIFPFIIRWFFKTFDDSVSQYVFVLAIVLLASFMAEVAGVEAIIGAFFAGLALNKFVPHSSPLMNRIDFVGNAIFIPFFLIGVGMLVDTSVVLKGWGTVKVAAVIVVVSLLTKYLAAILTQKIFGMTKVEGNMIFGLSSSHAAATLAIILVGYNIVVGETPTGEPIRLLNEEVLNGTIILILISCAVSSFVVQKASSKMALLEGVKKGPEDTLLPNRIMISLAYPNTVNDLVDIGFLLQPHKHRMPLYALHVVDEQEHPTAHTQGRKMLEQAQKHAAASDNTIIPLTRYDVNISNGIIYSIKEHAITDVIIGLHQMANENLYGSLTERLLHRTKETILIYKSAQPLNTVKRIVIAVPPNAVYEHGFNHWFTRIRTIAAETALPVVFYTDQQSKNILENLCKSIDNFTVAFNLFDDWEDFLIFSREVKKDDLFIIISSRKGFLAYHQEFEKLPRYLSRYFKDTSFIILYPSQYRDYTDADLKPLEENAELIDKAGRYVKRIFTGGSN